PTPTATGLVIRTGNRNDEVRLSRACAQARPRSFWIDLRKLDGDPRRIQHYATRTDHPARYRVATATVMDDLAPPGSNDQVVLNRRNSEGIGKLVRQIDVFRGRRNHFYNRIGRGHRIAGCRRPAIHDRVRLVVGVIVDLDGYTIAK